MSLLPGLGRAALDRLPATRRAGSLRSRSASLKAGLGIVALFAITSAVAVVWTPYPPDAKATGNFSAPPDTHHLFGTDATGGDVFSRALAASRGIRPACWSFGETIARWLTTASVSFLPCSPQATC